MTGCISGARTDIVAPNAEIPVSLSRGVRGADGKLVPSDAKVVVGQFEEEYTAWNILYGAIKLTPTKDISDDVNTQVRGHEGQAVINLAVRNEGGCALKWFIFPFSLIPFWPSCSNIHVQGDIIKVAEKTR